MSIVPEENTAFITQRAKTRQDCSEKRDEARKSLEALVCGIDQVSQATLLLKKKKEMHEVDDALELVKNDYKQRMETCEERRLQFEKKQNEMKENVAKFERFIQENDAKRQRAESRAKSERKQLEQKQNEEKQLFQKLSNLEEERSLQIEKLEKLKKYKNFLQKVVESSDAFDEIQDLIDRYATLRMANNDLIDQVQRGDNEMDTFRSKIEELKSKTQNILLVQNSLLQNKTKHLEQVRVKTKIQDDCKHTREERKKDVSRETAQIINAIRNIFQRSIATTRARGRLSLIQPDKNLGPENKTVWDQQRNELFLCLDFIRDRISDLDDIRTEYFRTHSSHFDHNKNILMSTPTEQFRASTLQAAASSLLASSSASSSSIAAAAAAAAR